MRYQQGRSEIREPNGKSVPKTIPGIFLLTQFKL
jgi:hypothetical protein